ncbi:hypothetical protein BDZ89DRAFT_1103600 [Hymenopellis radicata]|nr:hypothetical protein BDZ89DRAFT_1103600 [Hymenopellis radicata]
MSRVIIRIRAAPLVSLNHHVTITSIIALSLAAAVAATPLSTFPNSPTTLRSPLHLAPVINEHHVHGSINDSYIVVLKDDLPPMLKENHFNFLEMAHAENPLMSVKSGVQQVIKLLQALPEVDYIEPDQIVKTTEYTVHEVSTMDKQKGAPWGLARVSHRPRLTFGTFTTYEFAENGGEGVDVYVIDTGINVEHVDFEGRAQWGKTIPADVDEDGNGHGSHCAGTIAGHKYGVAKKANVIAVKVLGSNGSGSMSDVVGGVVYAAEAAAAKAAKSEAEYKATGQTSHKGSVANMSLGGGKSPALDKAVNNAVDAGLHFAVAAGNDNKDACSYSPAAAEKAVTVGASTLGDERAYFSNTGKCVDVFGPGLNIQSTYKGGPMPSPPFRARPWPPPRRWHARIPPVHLPPCHLRPISHQGLCPRWTPVAEGILHLRARTRCSSRWISTFLPSPELVAPVPGKPKTLTTTQLKNALIRLSSPDMLKDVGTSSPNLLIFNNATVA